MAYTLRQVYEGVQIELGKVDAPSLLLSEFNYFANKAINQYTNKQYNIYDVNQQATDSLRVLTSIAKLEVHPSNGIYEVFFPDDYLHLLKCTCTFKLDKPYKCQKEGSLIQVAAKKLTSDIWSEVYNNYYYYPSSQRPYYYITNKIGSTDMQGDYEVQSSNAHTLEVQKGQTKGTNFNRVIILNNNKAVSTVKKEIAYRYGNASKVRCEIHCGSDATLQEVCIDYIKVPQYVELTQKQLNLVKDTSQILEFPDYGCQEIINELVQLVLQRDADPRLQTFSLVTQSIAPPTQQQTPSQS